LLGGLERLNSGDILWVHNRPESAFALAPLVHAAGARLVLHMHNSHLLEQPAHRIQGAGIDRFVFVSKYLEGESRERFPGIADSTVLYNGADETMFSPPSMGRPDRAVPQILFASRLVRDKGAHIFLGAMRQLAAAGVKAKGIVVGASHFGGSKTTAYIGELHAMAPPNVELRPYCSGRELAEMFREVDVFCLPSVWQDPFPLAPLEAMACRLPVVATLSGGIPEAFAEGGAILVGRGSVDELAAALRELVTTPERRRELGAAGYVSFHKNFTWGIVRQRYRRIIESLS
jgi:spore coat protein SA